MKLVSWVIPAGILFLVLASAGAERPALNGRVLDDKGAPLPKATVFIYTAAPKTGAGLTCPSCYPDCNKKAGTDAGGKFSIPSLDPNLTFRLLVVAGGYQTTFVPKADPTNGETSVTLKPLDSGALNSKTRITGMVMDEKGEPVAGAVLDTQGVQLGEITHWGGTDSYVDPVAVSDERGFFLLPCQSGVDKVHALAEAKGVARRWVDLRPGQDHIIRMQEGVAIKGTLSAEGKPLKEVVVGLMTTERACGTCLHDFEAVTDASGQFLLLNVTPNNTYNIFAKMESLGERGALATRTIKAGASGTTIDLGELKIAPAHNLVGRVVLSDGKPIPPDTRLFLGREDAWDHTEVAVSPNGEFRISGVPEEPVSISVRVNGYKFSKRNPSLDWLNGGIVGHVDKDQKELTLLMEPGEWRYGKEEQDLPEGADSQPRNRPLRGVLVAKGAN